MKTDYLRKKSSEELLEIKRTLELDLIKTKCVWFTGKIDSKDIQRQGNQELKGITKKGTNTSLTKDLRRNIARINTLLRERLYGRK